MNIFGFFKKSKKDSFEPSDDGRRVMIHCMCAMAAADGDIGDDEVESMDAIYERLTGRKIGGSAIRQVAYPFLESSVSLSSMLENERDDLTDMEKALVLKASYLVLMADGVRDDAESEKLTEIEDGLGVSHEQAEVILKDVKV